MFGFFCQKRSNSSEVDGKRACPSEPISFKNGRQSDQKIAHQDQPQSGDEIYIDQNIKILFPVWDKQGSVRQDIYIIFPNHFEFCTHPTRYYYYY